MSESSCKAFAAACLLVFAFATLPTVRGSVSSPDKLTPILYWPYVDGTVLINSPKFQQVLANSTKFKYITWNICISKCASVDHLEWLHVASMDFNKTVRIENFTDSNLYGLDTRGILIINNQTGRNNGAYYKIKIHLTDFDVDPEFFKLLHFEDQQAHTGPPAACPNISNLSCAVCNCSISNDSTLPANDTKIAQTCPACPEVSKLNCTVCNCSNDTQKGEHGTAGMSIGCIVGLSLLSACCIILLIVLIKYRRLTATAKVQITDGDGESDGVHVNHGVDKQRDESEIESEIESAEDIELQNIYDDAKAL